MASLICGMEPKTGKEKYRKLKTKNRDALKKYQNTDRKWQILPISPVSGAAGVSSLEFHKSFCCNN